MSKRAAVTLTDAPTSQLERIPEVRTDVVTERPGYDAEFRKAVQAGLDDVAAGRTRPWHEVKEELRAKYGNFDD